MMKILYLVIILLNFSSSSSQKENAVKFLHDYNTNFVPFFKSITEAIWKQAINITNHNSKLRNEAKMKLTEEMTKLREDASKIDLTDADEDTKRQFRMLLTSKTSSNKTISKQLTEIGTAMSNIYSTGTISYDSNIIKSISIKGRVRKLRLSKHLIGIMAKSNNSDELLYVWKSWRDSVGPRVKDFYKDYVRLNNIGAKEHGFRDAGEYRRKQYEVDDLERIAEEFLKDMRSLYLELHGYVRYRLSKVYQDVVTEDGMIPAHLLGNMWAQSWGNIYKYVVPFPEEPTLDITPLLEANQTVNGMFKMAEGFFTSIGWPKLPRKFWTHSLFVEPQNRKVECHPSAWDFTDKENDEPDVRVKMCTKMTQSYFKTIHHELGHSYYQLLYWNQPIEYRDGANPGFHEAVGDTMVLSVQTPAHLKQIGLLSDISKTNEADINFLLKTALNVIAFLPFGYLMDKWMWDVYSGRIKPNEYNTKWWEYRMQYQGIKAPIERTENDFDPGAKMHIVSDVSYIRYFFAKILQFTFHKQACKLAEDTGPLHQCSIYRSKAAGDAFGEMLCSWKN